MGQKIDELILGSLLGDGGLEKNKGKKTRFRFKERHGLKQKNYLLWKKSILEKRFKVGVYYNNYSIAIYTSVDNYFDKYARLFYPKKGYREFNYNIIKLLTPFVISIWIMDNGYYNKNLKILTLSFHKKNLCNICRWFEEKYSFKIQKSIDGNCGVIRFSQQDTKKIIEIIKDYVHKDMIYKIGGTKNRTS